MVLQGLGLHQIEERWRALGHESHHLPQAGPLDPAGLACAALGMGRPVGLARISKMIKARPAGSFRASFGISGRRACGRNYRKRRCWDEGAEGLGGSGRGDFFQRLQKEGLRALAMMSEAHELQ